MKNEKREYKIGRTTYIVITRYNSSSDDLQGESNSITNQKAILEKYATEHGFTNAKYYVDDGYTDTNFNRPGFREMIYDVETGKICVVITKDLSHLGRNYL